MMEGDNPTPYIVITTDLGHRAYAEKEISSIFSITGYYADGTYTADGTITAGGDSGGFMEKSARVLSFGRFERSIQPGKESLLLSYSRKNQLHL